jgi:mono/diheme cytochrome c family protein
MKIVIHQGRMKGDNYDCLQCHANIGHAYEAPSSIMGGWYSVQQAAAGRKLYENSCSSCHGAKLEGRAGPALSGVTWRQKFGGAKLLTVWGEIKGPMAEYAGATLTTQESLDILTYLLEQNGLAAGNQPLLDTVSYLRPSRKSDEAPESPFAAVH